MDSRMYIKIFKFNAINASTTYYKYKYEINRPLLHIDPLSPSNESH